MTKNEAIQAMKDGKKVTHTYFTDDEWVSARPDGRQYTFEDGVKCFEGEFWHFRSSSDWETGWSIYKTN